ncbi:MAG: surface carbohydrate biosynthesis protein [Candidatus Poribacteria bacterium]
MPDLNVRLTGNPRTDFLRPELVSMYGPMKEEISETISSGYILINTNLTLNSRLSPRILSDLEKRISPESEEWIKRYDERKNAHLKWDTYNLKSTFKLIELFGQRSPNQKVLIRPHPIEATETYTKFSKKYSNVEVTNNQNSARPWILASDILIHTGCATGSEAIAMSHPTISIQGKDSEWVQCRVTNHVSYLTHTAEEAYQAVQDFYAGKLKLGDTSKLKEFWPAQEGKFAAERIADEIYQFYLDLGGSFGEFKLSFSGKFKQVRLTDFYKTKMFVELSQVEQNLREIYQQLPAMPQMKLYEISRNVFYMRSS